MTKEQLHERQPGTFEAVTTEAMSFMASAGYAHIRGYLQPEERQYFLGQLEDQHFEDLGSEADRLLYTSAGLRSVTAAQRVKRKMLADIAEHIEAHPELRDWFYPPMGGVNPITQELTRYPDGADLTKHLDEVDAIGWPTQALFTLEGTATFQVFESMESEVPIASFSLQPGDLVLLRGNEFEDGQLPHAVLNNQGRTFFNLYPNPDLPINYKGG